jgi:two-component system chemotaxis response regulator CheY
MSAAERRVLIVEDSPAMRQLLSFALRRLPGAVVEQAGDGLAALRALAATRGSGRPFDLVLLDLNMPVMDGMRLLERMHAEGDLARTAVAVITTEESGEVEAEARRHGARYFLRKPVNRKSVERMLGELFGLAELGG